MCMNPHPDPTQSGACDGFRPCGVFGGPTRSVVDDMVHEELIAVPGRVSTYPRYDRRATD